MPFTFEKLFVYQKAVNFAEAVCALPESFPRGYGFLTDQLTRAALSIATNLAEGNGRFTRRDRRNFFGIARGSAQECVPLLEECNQCGEGFGTTISRRGSVTPTDRVKTGARGDHAVPQTR